MKRPRLYFPKALRSRKRRRDSCFHYLYGYREGNAETGSNLSESRVIAQPLGEGLGSAQVVQHPLVFTKRQQGIAHVKPQINSLLQRVAAFGEMRQGCERLLKVGHGFVVR